MLSIIVLSSDGYSDCWEPFFFLLKKNFPEAANHEIILSSNSKKFTYSGLNIKCLLHGKKSSWSKRLKLSLNYASNEIVMVLVEDFFILSKMNINVFNNLLAQIVNNNKIDHIRLLYKMDKVQTEYSKYMYLDEIKSKSKYRFLYLPGLWNINVLKKYIVDFETPYMAEKMADIKSRIFKDGFYAISNHYIEKNGEFYDCATSGAIIKGKWGKWLPKRMEENGLFLNYKFRGFKDKESSINANYNIYKSLIQNPMTTLKSFLSFARIFFKSKFISSI